MRLALRALFVGALLVIAAATTAATARFDCVLLSYQPAAWHDLFDATDAAYAPAGAVMLVEAGVAQDRQATADALGKVIVIRWSSTMDVDRRDGELWAPAGAPQASADRRDSNTGLAAPIAEYLMTAVDFEPNCVTTVAPLLRGRGPTAVFWRVGAVVVASVERVLGRRLRAHIGDESCEATATAPTFADDYAAPAIALEATDIGVAAACDHTPIGTAQRMISLISQDGSSGNLRVNDAGQACRRTRFSGATLAPQTLYHKAWLRS